MERGAARATDLRVLDRALTALGLRTTLEIEGRHLADRADQRDPVHAALTLAMAGRLARCGWAIATEVPTGRASPTGRIDRLGYRSRDAALAIVELKADLPDVGGLQRQVASYEREGAYAGPAARLAAVGGRRRRRLPGQRDRRDAARRPSRGPRASLPGGRAAPGGLAP